MQTERYQKAIRKRMVWIEPLFAEGKLWHCIEHFREMAYIKERLHEKCTG